MPSLAVRLDLTPAKVNRTPDSGHGKVRYLFTTETQRGSDAIKAVPWPSWPCPSAGKRSCERIVVVAAVYDRRISKSTTSAVVDRRYKGRIRFLHSFRCPRHKIFTRYRGLRIPGRGFEISEAVRGWTGPKAGRPCIAGRNVSPRNSGARNCVSGRVVREPPFLTLRAVSIQLLLYRVGAVARRLGPASSTCSGHSRIISLKFSMKRAASASYFL